jgi:hypothetical protein
MPPLRSHQDRLHPHTGPTGVPACSLLSSECCLLALHRRQRPQSDWNAGWRRPPSASVLMLARQRKDAHEILVEREKLLMAVQVLL